MVERLSLTGKQWCFGTGHNAFPLIQRYEELLPTLARLHGLDALDPPLPHPNLLPSTQKAVERLRVALHHREHIALFGDYDCDGITAVAQIVHLLERHGATPYVRLPHRTRDGYGLNKHVLDEFYHRGIQLLFTIDTGISSGEEIRELQRKGIDVIILDHHQTFGDLPPAFAIIHPALESPPLSPPPSAAGIAFIFVRAFEDGTWECMEEDLALAAVGTIADVVELRGINRALVLQGLRAFTFLRTSPLLTLAVRAGCTLPPSSQEVAFRIAPRLNAAGRMSDPFLALTALLKGGSALKELEDLNLQRQSETTLCFAHILRSLHLTPPLREHLSSLPPFLCIGDASYPPGLLGLLAGKLTALTGKPSLIAHIQGDTCTASLRSPASYDISQGLRRSKHLLTSFGGHTRAAGALFPLSVLPRLQEHLSNDVACSMGGAPLLPTLILDCAIAPSLLTLPSYRILQRLSPFGEGNQEPRFLLPSVTLKHPRTVGKEGTHLQARIGNTKLVGFDLGRMLPHLRNPLDLACRFGLSTWQGREELQLFLDDLRIPKQSGGEGVGDYVGTHAWSHSI